ncbi:MAG TPA: DUF3696 domain-containing protein [Nannocystis sp.]
MLRSLRLQNFRSLRDTGDVELRPIVLLVGANSSGKSSFLRFFPLLKQTAQANSRSPLLWFREERGLVDFRDFENTLSRGAPEPEIIIAGALDEISINPAGESATCRFRSHIAAKNGTSYLRSFHFQCLDDTLVANFDASRRVTSMELQGADAIAHMDPSRREVALDSLIPNFSDTLVSTTAHIQLSDKIWERVHGRTGSDKIDDIALNVDYGSAEHVQQAMLEISGGAKRWRENIQALKPTDPYIQEIKRLAFLRAVGGRDYWNPMETLASSLHGLANGVRYIGPFRRKPDRFYRQTEVSVDEIDATGSNLAMFLYSLDEPGRVGFSSWVYEHFGFHVRAERREAQVVLRIDTGSESHFDLTDMGFGISQLLPVAAQCWLSSQGKPRRQGHAPSVVAIEQPELHLHPHHQFQLADMFLGLATAAKETHQRLTLCIETHSEAMIHRFGELVAEDPRRRDDITILFFEKAADSDVSNVRQIEFDAEGVLQNWPIGFFRG